jgi:hypothetical protein
MPLPPLGLILATLDVFSCAQSAMFGADIIGKLNGRRGRLATKTNKLAVSAPGGYKPRQPN